MLALKSLSNHAPVFGERQFNCITLRTAGCSECSRAERETDKEERKNDLITFSVF